MSTDFLPEFLCRHLLFPSILKSLLMTRYTFSKLPDLKFRNNSLFGDEWKDAPESKIQDSIGLSTLRIRASPMSSAKCIESSSFSDLWFCFLFVQSARKLPFSPQLQHFTFGLFGDFSRFLDFDRPLFGPFDLLLPLRSTLRALSDESPISRLRILSLRTTSQISSNFSLSDPRELLIAATTISHDLGKDDIKINVLISSSKLISTELNWLTIVLNRSTFRHLWIEQPPHQIHFIHSRRFFVHIR